MPATNEVTALLREAAKAMLAGESNPVMNLSPLRDMFRCEADELIGELAEHIEELNPVCTVKRADRRLFSLPADELALHVAICDAGTFGSSIKAGELYDALYIIGPSEHGIIRDSGL